MEDKDRERLREVERQYEILKERLIDINLGINHIKGMYKDVDDRGNEHARRIEEVRRNTENILRQLEQHHEALFKPPGSIYILSWRN